MKITLTDGIFAESDGLQQIVWRERSASVEASKRGKEFDDAASELSEYINGLPLTAEQNNELVRLAVKMVNVSEKCAFLQGCEFGLVSVSGEPAV